MDSKVIIVTGANTGIGFNTTKLLVEDGNEVIMACRNMERGNAALKKILTECPQPKCMPVVYELDLADFSSIRRFAEKFKEKYATLHVLLNNAGVSMGEGTRFQTKDGNEMVTGTNHLGHFLLTHLLLDLIKATAESHGEARIAVVASEIHTAHENKRFGNMRPMDFDDFSLEKAGAYNDMQAYKDSKTMNVLFTLYLARQLEGTGVTVNCICPGFVPSSDLFRNMKGCLKCIFACFVPCLQCCRITRSLDTAAFNVRNLCTDPGIKGITGRWYVDGRQRETAEETRDLNHQEALWRWSLERCGL